MFLIHEDYSSCISKTKKNYFVWWYREKGFFDKKRAKLERLSVVSVC